MWDNQQRHLTKSMTDIHWWRKSSDLAMEYNRVSVEVD
jgi:hypothetical protein